MRTAKKQRSKQRVERKVADTKQPFIEHVHELRRRLTFVGISVAIGATAAYGVQQQIVGILLRPAEKQQFIYTSPGGGIDFLFRLCLFTGIIVSIPVIVYQILKYIQPLIKRESTQFIKIGSVLSGILAIIGMLYGYFLGLPAALKFLLNQFITTQIQPLLTIQAYMSFVMVYMLGSALLLQVPLLLILINRIKPINPKRLLKYERHVIVAAVVIAAIMNPTPNIFALLMIAMPLIIMYQVGIFIIWSNNRKRSFKPRPKQVVELREEDSLRRAERILKAQSSQPLMPAAAMASPASGAAMAMPTPQLAQANNSVQPRQHTRAQGHSPVQRRSSSYRGRKLVI